MARLAGRTDRRTAGYSILVSGPEESSSGETAEGRAFRGLGPGGERVLVVVLGEGVPEDLWQSVQEAVRSSAELSSTAELGGSALVLAIFAAASRAAERGDSLPEPAFAISVGEAVRLGLPTAARATITGRAPLRSGLVEAPFGGQFARAFSTSTDVALVFGGRASQRAVLHIDDRGRVSIAKAPFKADAETPARAAQLAPPGEQHALLVGPAAEMGLPFANLGSWSAPAEGEGHGAPSLVGRGGIGFTVASAGVVAVTVAASAPPSSKRAESLTRALEASPRLIARAKGGTLELGAVRRGSAVREGPAAEAGMRPTKHGCVGCPTPCGWQFDLVASEDARDANEVGAEVGPGVGGRFAALQGFLGDGDMHAAMAAVHACNLLGMDARSAALVLGEVPAEIGDRAAVRVRHLLDPTSPLHRAALALRKGSDVEPISAHMPGDLASRVGVAFAARGPEPLRSLSVFGLKPTDDAEFNAGVMAHWHECYSAAVDVTGFCAFSASALLADGVLTLEELSARVPFRATGRDWLAAGAAVAALHREINGRDDGASSLDRVAEAHALPAAAVRGYYESVHRGVSAFTRGDAETAPSADLSKSASRLDGAADDMHIVVHVAGSLATRLASYPDVMEGPEAAVNQSRMRLQVSVAADGESVRSVLERIAERVPRASGWLLRAGGAPLPAVLIAGRSVPGEWHVQPGDELELLLVIPGG